MNRAKPRTTRTFRGFVILAIGAVMIVPGLARAEVPVLSFFDVLTYPITPYNSAQVKFVGNVSNVKSDTKIIVTATDGGVSPPSTAGATNIWLKDDPGVGRSAGDFDGVIAITNLGTHDGTAAKIDIVAVAYNGRQEPSNDMTAIVLKESADTNDTYEPQRPVLSKTPPSQWCHILSTNYGCLDTSGALSPGITLLPVCPININGLPCRLPFHNGHVQIIGFVKDASPAIFIASEIQDVVIQIKDANDQLVKEFHNVFRQNTTGYFNQSLVITDYKPGDYLYRVFGIDARGNVGPAFESGFTVMPDGCPTGVDAIDQSVCAFLGVR